MLLLAIAILSAYWIHVTRRQGEPWDQVLVVLLFHIVPLLVLAWFFPGWVWRVVLLAYVTFPFWGAMWSIWRTHRFPPEVGLEPWDAGRHGALAPRVEAGARRLEAAGLVRTATFTVTGASPATMTRVQLETPDGHEAVALTTAGAPPVKGARDAGEVHHMIGVMMRFGDGRMLGVSTGDAPAVPLEGERLEHFPSVSDPARLLAVARAYRARFFADAASLPVRGGVPVLEFFADRYRRVNAAEARAGRLRELPDGGWAYTVRGVVSQMMSVSFPFRQIRAARIRRREARLLRELGMGAEPIGRESIWAHGPNDANMMAAVAIAIAVVLPLPSMPPTPIIAAFADGGAVASFSSAGKPRPYHLPSGFAVPADFPGAVRALEQLTGATAAPLTVEDWYTRTSQPADGVQVRFAAERTDSLLARAAPLFHARGFLLFRVGYTFGIDGEPETIALYPRDAPSEIMQMMGTNGTNYDMDPDSVVRWLGGLRSRHALAVTGIGSDYVQAQLLAPLNAGQAHRLAADLYAVCPDVVTQGAGSRVALAAELRKSGTLYCWWD